MNHIFREEGNLKCSKNVRSDLLTVGIPTGLHIAPEGVKGVFKQPFMSS